MIRGYADYLSTKTQSADLENLQRVQSIRAMKPPGNPTQRRRELAAFARSDGSVTGLDFPAPRNSKRNRKDAVNRTPR